MARSTFWICCIACLSEALAVRTHIDIDDYDNDNTKVPLKLLTYTLNKPVFWTLMPPSTKRATPTFSVHCPMNDGSYTEMDLGTLNSKNAYYSFKGEDLPHFLDTSKITFTFDSESRTWKITKMKCLLSSLNKLRNRLIELLEFLYHFPPMFTNKRYIKPKLLLMANITPRDVCAAGRIWELLLARYIRSPDMPSSSPDIKDFDFVMDWKSEHREKDLFEPEFVALVESKVQQFKSQCGGSFDEASVLPKEDESFAFASQPADWWLEKQMEERRMKFYGMSEAFPVQENLNIVWNGEYIHVKEWHDNPKAMPYKYTSDTHAVSSVLIGSPGVKECSDQQAGIERVTSQDAFASGSCQIDEDVQQIVDALQNRSVPVCRLKQHGRARWENSCNGKNAKYGNEVWARDWGFLFKGNDMKQVPIVYERTDEFFKALNLSDKNLIDDLQSWELPPMQLEGGNILGTGTGVCFSTTEMLYKTYSSSSKVCNDTAQRSPNYYAEHGHNFDFASCHIAPGSRPLDVEPIRKAVLHRMKQLGCHTWIFTESAREQTRHIDVFMGQLTDTKFMVGEIKSQDDPFNSLLLEAARNTMKRLSKPFDFEVVDIPMPPQLTLPEAEFADTRELERDMRNPRACWLLDAGSEASCTFQPGDCCSERRYKTEKDHQHVFWQVKGRSRYMERWRSYTNYLPVRHSNQNFAIVPSFFNAKYNNKFMQRIQHMENDVRDIIGSHFQELVYVNQDVRVSFGGSIHCMTRGVPTGVPIEATVCA